jgi:dolichol-phosphate mannosyltransferase
MSPGAEGVVGSLKPNPVLRKPLLRLGRVSDRPTGAQASSGVIAAVELPGPIDCRVRISLVVPTYNERESLPLLVNALREVMGNEADWELIVVDDDSPDQTWKVAEELAGEDRRIRVYRRLDCRGLSSAVVAGLSVAGGDRVVVMDADLQHDVTRVPQLVAALDDAPLAVGTRYAQGGGVGGWGRGRVALSRAATVACNLVLGLAVSDPMSGFFAVRREEFNRISSRLNPRGYKILMELMAVMRPARVEEIPYVFAPRRCGESKLSARVAWAFGFALIELLTRSMVSPRFLKYAFVGLSGVGVYSLARGLLVSGFGQTEAGILTAGAVAISALSNYFWNNVWTFRDRRHVSLPAVVRGVVLFGLVSGTGAVISRAVAGYFSSPLEGLGWGMLAPAAGFAIATLWNYFLNHDLTWRGHDLSD